MVEKSWNEDGIRDWGCYVFTEKLKRLKCCLKKWNADYFGIIDHNIAALRDEIHGLDLRDDTTGLNEGERGRRREAAAQLLRQLHNRKCLLAQKAKLRWLKDGDGNSRLFHKSIIVRRRLNSIAGVEMDGTWAEEPRIVKDYFRDQFSQHFKREDTVKARLAADFETPKLHQSDGDFLISDFTEEEVRTAIWDCGGSKSPGPNGFNSEFLRACWSVINNDLMKAVRDFHANGKWSRGSNSSFITLIPKKSGAHSINHFWPISLIGSLYKIVAKILAKRLQAVLGNLIGDSQSAFLKGRNILDGPMILNEVLEEACSSKQKRLVLKVDFAKAFDSVDWDYLIELMRRMYFPSKWLRWIKGCISSAFANVLVNGSSSGEFQLERGLRQGDPLSSFLFLIAAEDLNLLTKRAISEGLLTAVHVGRNKVEISHLQYADDTLFVVDGKLENTVALKQLLKNFEALLASRSILRNQKLSELILERAR